MLFTLNHLTKICSIKLTLTWSDHFGVYMQNKNECIRVKVDFTKFEYSYNICMTDPIVDLTNAMNIWWFTIIPCQKNL